MDLNKFENKKIGIIGFGLEGRAIFDFFKKNGINPTILDKHPKLQNSLPEETEIVGGEEYLENLEKFDILVRSPGIPLSTPQLQIAAKSGVEITSQTKIFFDLCPCPIIGVTGTKGKGTTSTLIYEMLKAGGKDVFLCGNIGIVAVNLLEKLTEKSLVVMELSSFQLQDLHKSPHIAVILSVTSDHLNHHKTQQEYLEAKSTIVKSQQSSDAVIFNRDSENAAAIGRRSLGRHMEYSLKDNKGSAFLDSQDLVIQLNGDPIKICRQSDIKLIGLHNIENVLAAALAAYTVNPKVNPIQKVATAFSGLPHRTEIVGEFSGVAYVNDSLSTMPDSTIAALNAFNGPILLIAGGSEKGADYATLGKIIADKNLKTLITLDSTGEKISAAAKANGFPTQKIKSAQTLEEAVRIAKNLAKKGDTVLLSPASASFGMFKDAKERGAQFTEYVKL